MAKGINLDNLFDSDKHEVEGENSGVMDVVVTPKPQTKKEKTKEDTSTNSIYDKLQTLLYCVDISGSMADGIKSDKPDVWDWPSNIKDHIARQLSFTEESELNEQEFALKQMLTTATDEEVKNAVFEIGPNFYGIYQKSDPSRTKMALVKKSIADLVDRRYEKYPDARVVLETFNAEATIEAATHESIKQRLQMLQPNGGTNIYYAVEQALAYFTAYPSPVGLNHLIVVSDGEDWNAIQIKADLLEKMKEMGVVLDYIYIKGVNHYPSSEDSKSAVAQMFTELCKELNGEYTEVSSASEFEKKLLAYSTRLCLPPGVN